jgi:transcriptional regulator with XRE-family HTH domain
MMPLESEVTAVLVNGHMVRELRIKHSYSQEKLAAIVGVNLRTIQRIETKGVASLDTRGALARALEVRPEDLDVPASAVLVTQSEPRPRLSFLVIAGALVVVGTIILGVAVYSAPYGLITLPAVIGALVALIGFYVLSQITPLRGWRGYALLVIYLVSLVGSPPSVTIHGLIVIALWAAFELGILLTRFGLRQSRA